MNAWNRMLVLVAEGVGATPFEGRDGNLDAFEAAVHLAQVGGLELGYRFRSVSGLPTCPRLCDEFDEIMSARGEPGSAPERLVAAARKRVEQLRSKLRPPKDIGADEWIQAVAFRSIDPAYSCEAQLLAYNPALADAVRAVRSKDVDLAYFDAEAAVTRASTGLEGVRASAAALVEAASPTREDMQMRFSSETSAKPDFNQDLRIDTLLSEGRDDPEHRRRLLEAGIRHDLSEFMMNLRLRRNLSASELAARVGQHPSLVRKLESGGYDALGFGGVRTYARAMGMDLKDVVMLFTSVPESFTGHSTPPPASLLGD